MEAVRVRHVSVPTEKQAKNRDKIVKDKAGREGSGKRKNRSGRQAKIDGGERAMLILLRPQYRWPLMIRRDILLCGHSTHVKLLEA